MLTWPPHHRPYCFQRLPSAVALSSQYRSAARNITASPTHPLVERKTHHPQPPPNFPVSPARSSPNPPSSSPAPLLCACRSPVPRAGSTILSSQSNRCVAWHDQTAITQDGPYLLDIEPRPHIHQHRIRRREFPGHVERRRQRNEDWCACISSKSRVVSPFDPLHPYY